jgi:hypothetical protein
LNNVLHQKRLIVPEPGDPTRIRMAPPFPGIETRFRVNALGKQFFANCAWDALGIPAALHADASVHLAEAWYGNRLTAESRRPGPGEMVGIFASIGLEGPLRDPDIAPAWHRHYDRLHLNTDKGHSSFPFLRLSTKTI